MTVARKDGHADHAGHGNSDGRSGMMKYFL